MTTFVYKAIPAGASAGAVTGRADADSADTVRESLRGQGLIVLELKPERHGLVRLPFTHRGVSRANTVWFFRTLRRMLAASVPIEQAMSTMVELSPNDPARAACATALGALRSGEPLAEAVEKTPGLARPQHLAILRVGHQSGRLDECVALIERSIASRERLRRTVTGKLIYPAILVIASIGAVWILATFVIPKFAETLASAGAQLPLPTRITLVASRWMMWMIPPVILAGLVALSLKPADLPERWRRRLDRLLLRLPVARDMVWLAQGAVVANTLATMLEGGGDLLAGLVQAQSAVTSPSVADRLVEATRAVREGGDVGGAMHEYAVLPPEADALVRIGARSGDLVGSLKQAAAVCVEKQELAADRLLTLMGPAIILALASMVGWIVYSLISGMLSMNDISSMG